MRKYDLARTVKGAYHQNPAYAHWYGNAELKMDLVDIRSEASCLRGAGIDKGGAAQVGEELEILKRRMERGELSAEEYRREKEKRLQRLLPQGR
ncbi:MAG TPA: SHOCT domain-containing protein [Verrucomicrobiae bacterium]|nr:SHOCT domain-containing protein [Verrucomicrobiae bacterium]